MIFSKALDALKLAKELSKINQGYQYTLREQEGITYQIIDKLEALCKELGLEEDEDFEVK